MMGRSHAVSGLLAGCGLVWATPSAPWPVHALSVGVAGGSALLPDLDHPSGSAARSLGLLTKSIAHVIDWLSLAIYHATRTRGDKPDCRDGHRTVTHTIPGCLFFGFLTAGVTPWPIPSAVTLGLLCGLLGVGLRTAGFPLAGTGGALAWWTTSEDPGWWWLFAVAVFVGCLAHVLGDAMTNSGVPLWWPLIVEGKRWHRVTTPATFSTGKVEENLLVFPTLVAALFVAASAVTGVLSVVIAAVTAAAAQ